MCVLIIGSSRGTSGRSVGGGSTSHSSEGGSDWTSHDTGPHREMAVDVPDTFVARTKTPPRYPPPKPSNATTMAPPAAPVPVNNNSPGLRKKVVTAQAAQVASNGLAAGLTKPVPPSREHLRMEEDGRTVVINHPASQVCFLFLFSSFISLPVPVLLSDSVIFLFC